MKFTLYIFLACIFFSCASCVDTSTNIIKDIHIGLHNNNQLRIQIDVTTVKDAEVYAEYWPDSAKNEKLTSLTSKKGLQHSLVLTNILPDTKYDFQLCTISNGEKIAKQDL